MDSDKQIEYCVVIADRKAKDELVALLIKSGARVIDTMYGKGSVKASTLQDVFGFVPERNKIVITGLIPSTKSELLVKTLDKEFNFNKPNSGIAFTIPVEKLSF